MDVVSPCNWWQAPDHAWIGVLRTAPACSRHHNHFACDGFCRQPGAPGMEGDEEKMAIRDRLYGCWFYTVWNASYASAAYVNVGKSLRVYSRCTVSRVLGMDVKNRSAHDALCQHEDRLWCERARARGFDSIQILRGTYYAANNARRSFGELVLCTGACASRVFAPTACVPAARHITENGEVRACDCPEGAISLSCDGVPRVPHAAGNESFEKGCASAFRWLDERPDRPDRILGTARLHAAPDTQCRLRAPQVSDGTRLPIVHQPVS